MAPSENTPPVNATVAPASQASVSPSGAMASVLAADTPGAGAAEGPRPVWVALAWAAVALFVFSLAFFPLRSSHDEWWHLKTGKWIVEHGMRLPEKDVFTYTAADYKWDNHEWLTEVAMYDIWRWGEDHDLGGWRTVTVVKELLLVAVYLLLGRFVSQRAGGGVVGLGVGVFVAVLAADVGRRMFYPRPPIVTNLLLAFYLYVLWLHRSGRLRTPWLLVLPFLMPLWANLHGGFLLGGVAVGAYAAGEALEWAGGRVLARRSAEAMRSQWVRAWTYAGLGVLCGLASLCNPFGYRVYLLSSRVMRDRFLVGVLSELLPTDFRFTWGFAFLAILLAAGMAAVLAAALERGRDRERRPTGSRSLALTGLFALVSLVGWAFSAAHFEGDLRFDPEGSAQYQCCTAYAVAVLGLAAAAGCLIVAWWVRRLDRASAAPAGGNGEAIAATAGFAAWPPLADLLIAAFFFSQALQHVRHLILFGIGGAPLLAWLLARAHGVLGTSGRGRLRLALGAASAVIVLWVLCLPGEAVSLARFGRRVLAPSQLERNLQLWRGEEVIWPDYPREAADFLLQARIPSDPDARLPGRLFNRDNSSGYLIWALSPEHYRLFTDSRFDIFGGDFLPDEMSVVNVWTPEYVAGIYRENPSARPGLRDWHAVIDHWGINLMLIEKGEKIHGYLLRQCFQDWLTANAPPALAHDFAQASGVPDAQLVAWLSNFSPSAARPPAAPASEWALLHVDASFAVWLRRAPGHEPWTDRYENWQTTVQEFLQLAEARRKAAAAGARP